MIMTHKADGRRVHEMVIYCRICDICQLAVGAIQNSHRDQLSFELEVREEGAQSLNF